jgi:L-asparaginase
VRKVHTSSVRAFASPGYGPIGYVDGEGVIFSRRPERRPPLPVPDELAAVDLIRLHAGSDARFLRAAVDSGARAIVVLEGTGPGETQTSRSSRACAKRSPPGACHRLLALR